MKHASPRLPRVLCSLALILTLTGTAGAQAAGFKIHGTGSISSHTGYGAHLGTYTPPWHLQPVQSVQLGPWSGTRSYAKHHAPRPVRTWVPGGWKIERERIWVAGAPRTVWVEPVYSTKLTAYGTIVNVLVTPGHYATVPGPGYWTVRPKKVWVPGHWQLGH